MTAAKAFIDSNVLLYLLSADSAKAERAEAVVGANAVVSVQVLNEVANVLRRKAGMPWSEVREAIGLIRSLCETAPLTAETHDEGCRIAERYGLSVYDAMIVASALIAGCKTVYSEDMQDGLVVDRRLRIRNPFRAHPMVESE
jgi:predicted nucleic acid-binding protein